MSGAESVRRSAPLQIHAFAGYDHRDALGGGAQGLVLRFTALEPGAFAATLRVDTGWMARPLVGPQVLGAVQARYLRPGLDANEATSYPTCVVVLCVPLPAGHPAYADRMRAGDMCLHLGVPAAETVVPGVEYDARAVLITSGPDALDTWLRTLAHRQLESQAPEGGGPR